MLHKDGYYITTKEKHKEYVNKTKHSCTICEAIGPPNHVQVAVYDHNDKTTKWMILSKKQYDKIVELSNNQPFRLELNYPDFEHGVLNIKPL